MKSAEPQPPGMRTVLEGKTDSPNMHWRVTAGLEPDQERTDGADRRNFGTYIECSLHEKNYSFGFSGPKLYLNSSINSWCGKGDLTPYIFLARVSLAVNTLTASDTRGQQLKLDMSDAYSDWGLRFGVAFSTEGFGSLTAFGANGDAINDNSGMLSIRSFRNKW